MTEQGKLAAELKIVRTRISELYEDISALKSEESDIVSKLSSITGGCSHCQNSHYPHCEVVGDVDS